MSTKREPLLSDELINYSCFSNVMATSREREIAKNAMEDVRSMYEAARAKDAELIQQLVYWLHRVKSLPDVDADADERCWMGDDALAAAAAQGFKPSEP